MGVGRVAPAEKAVARASEAVADRVAAGTARRVGEEVGEVLTAGQAGGAVEAVADCGKAAG